MITLTRLNGQRFVLNAELIRMVEARPDTVITLTGGEHYVVQEEVKQVVARTIDYGRMLRRLVPLADPDAPGYEDVPGDAIARGA